MNILHMVSGNLSGGAARGAYWLHRALLRNGVDSHILNNSQLVCELQNVQSMANTKKEIIISKVRAELDALPIKLYAPRETPNYSTGIFGVNFFNTEYYRSADIVHLHLIHGGFIDIKSLSKVNKPIVWTMRTMWPITGGCQFAYDCEGYMTGCGKCPQLDSNSRFDLSRYVAWRKAKYIPENISLVGISHWLSACALKSRLFHNCDIRTIPNGIDLTEFSPVDKEIARSLLGIDTRKRIVLVGAHNLNSSHKGFEKLIGAAKQLNEEEILFLFFGNLDSNVLDGLQIEYRNLGFLHDTVSLKLAYSAADVFVAPSLVESFGKTLVEAMACKTPVVCFDATGPKDIVDHKRNGYKAKPFDENDLATGIKWILDDTERHNQLCIQAREKTEACFDIDRVAGQYMKLYKELLAQ